MDDLKTIQNLQDNWDGEGASKFSENLITRAYAVLSCLPVEMDVFPTGRDSIQFERESEDGNYLEFEVFEDKIICFSRSGSGEKSLRPVEIGEIEEIARGAQ